MTIRERIIDCLQSHPEGLNDDQLTELLNLSRRQTANSYCRRLEVEGHIRRDIVDGIINNFLMDIPVEIHQQHNITENENIDEMSVEEYQLQWYWEGNVQATLVKYLKSLNYNIVQEVDTRTHQRGVDVITEKGGQEMWITVKGYPRPKRRTNPRLQAAHWFASALYDIIKYREKDNSVQLAFALPDFERYRNISKGISWFKKASGFTYFWVNNNGMVDEE
ncbi:MAG: hypothetical protein CVU42_07565 [Chloroflexi bacterium HGW-Chloroflexi-4]|jgi:hypothetical protein|nr:MAG: hypothetical protein CVU42_07565 [Chloroflexi bacterium HGW-Chloroflexi-4]